jgi:threonine 3-dehydrogenase
MKAIVKSFASKGLWMEERPIPTIGDNDILIKIRNTSICGTDVHIYEWDAWAQKTIAVPMVIGHEFMGTIAEMGKSVKGFQIGDRVAGEGHLTCGKCRNCLEGKKHVCVRTLGLGVQRQGCFAEYLSLPSENVFALPPSVSDEVASIFDPFGNAVHTALSCDLVGEDVLITGAGPIGIMAAAVARKAGARHVVVTDVNPYRLNLAQQAGATCIVDVSTTSLQETMQKLSIKEGFTVGMEMSGSPQALTSQLNALGHGGHLSLLGILPPGSIIDWNLVIFKMLTLKGIYGREIFSTWFKMVHMLESGLDISSVITHRFPFEEFQKGFDSILAGKCGKVVLNLE